MTPREDIDRIIANLEEEHFDGCDNESCLCFNRLTAALRGEPDPCDRNYEWPILHYGCDEPPIEGPQSPIDYATEQICLQIAENMYRDSSLLSLP